MGPIPSVPAHPDGHNLPRQFASRQALQATLQGLFPQAPGPLSPIAGGRRAALERLAAIEPHRYGQTRNALAGAVTRLSPYIRHGVLPLAEVRDAVFAWLEASGAPRQQGEKLIQELAWRDYWQRLWQQLGDGIWHNREPLKTGHAPEHYASALPEDIRQGQTGLACIDAFSSELSNTGWLHNHARMWLASYVVHWRRVQWQAGARWFLQHLLDGDPASNNLSWQWVASCFSSKPYIFNRANLERFSGGVHCQACGAAAAGRCPFDASYEALASQLFAEELEPAPHIPARPDAPVPGELPAPSPALKAPVVWVHGEALGPANPALLAHPDRPALFVFDDALINSSEESQGLSLKRLGFLYECLLELPLTLRRGDVAAQVLAFARRHGADGVVTSTAVDPRFASICAQIATELPVQMLATTSFVPLEAPVDLRRFSRYWRRAEPALWSRWPLTASAPPGAGPPPAGARPRRGAADLAPR
jgi:deoxyribodipyrimidine photo-lyase